MSLNSSAYYFKHPDVKNLNSHVILVNFPNNFVTTRVGVLKTKLSRSHPGVLNVKINQGSTAPLVLVTVSLRLFSTTFRQNNLYQESAFTPGSFSGSSMSLSSQVPEGCRT